MSFDYDTFATVGKNDESFKINGQEWVILEKNDMKHKPNIRRVFEQNGIEASLLIKRPNGKKLYTTPLFQSGHVYQSRISKA